MKSLLTCLGLMSLLVLTFTVSSNGYQKAYARGDWDALGTKIMESINNQITQELSGSAEPNPSSSSGSSLTTSSLSPSSVSSGLTTPTSTATSASTPLPTILTLTVGNRTGDENELSGRLLSPTRFATTGAIITFTGTDKDGSTHIIVDRSGNELFAITDIDGNYHTAAKLEMVQSVTAHFIGRGSLPAIGKSESQPESLPLPGGGSDNGGGESGGG
jgi:hypothetical protein